MQVPLQFTFKNMQHSPAIEARIRERAGKLDQFTDRIIACHVLVEKLPQAQEVYNVKVNVVMPNKKELVTSRNENPNLFLSITEAFDDMMRQVEEWARKIQGHVKAHEEVLHGEIARLFEVDSFGFISANDGEEYYFNSGSLHHPPFDHLKVGMKVKFIPAWDNDGPRALRVTAKNGK